MRKKWKDWESWSKALFIGLLAFVALVIYNTSNSRKPSANIGFFSGGSGEKKVWICTGPYSKRYHRDLDCKGIENCSGDTKLVTISEAEEMGRTPCGYCYGDATHNW